MVGFETTYTFAGLGAESLGGGTDTVARTAVGSWTQFSMLPKCVHPSPLVSMENAMKSVGNPMAIPGVDHGIYYGTFNGSSHGISFVIS